MLPTKKRKTITNKEWSSSDNYSKKLRQHPPLKLSDEEKKKCTFKSPYPQQYPFPENLIYYICKNPSFPNGHIKLISSCKALFLKSQIIPIKKLEYYGIDEEDEDKCELWCPNDDECSINIENQIFKLWIYDEVSITDHYFTNAKPDAASFLVKHVQLFSLRELTLHNQILTFEELQILCSGENLKEIDFWKNVVKNSDGSIAEYEKVFEVFCCKNMNVVLHDDQHGVGSNTANKIIEILSSERTAVKSKIHLNRIPESFDFQPFSAFLKTNMNQQKHTIGLSFTETISAEFKNQLQNFVKEIIGIRGIYTYTVPIINFDGQNEKAFQQLWKMRNAKIEGILTKP